MQLTLAYQQTTKRLIFPE